MTRSGFSCTTATFDSPRIGTYANFSSLDSVIWFGSLPNGT